MIAGGGQPSPFAYLQHDASRRTGRNRQAEASAGQIKFFSALFHRRAEPCPLDAQRSRGDRHRLCRLCGVEEAQHDPFVVFIGFAGKKGGQVGRGSGAIFRGPISLVKGAAASPRPIDPIDMAPPNLIHSSKQPNRFTATRGAPAGLRTGATAWTL